MACPALLVETVVVNEVVSTDMVTFRLFVAPIHVLPWRKIFISILTGGIIVGVGVSVGIGVDVGVGVGVRVGVLVGTGGTPVVVGVGVPGMLVGVGDGGIEVGVEVAVGTGVFVGG